MPAIAISYGHHGGGRALDLANIATTEVVRRLSQDWGHEDQTRRPIQLYSINVPVEALLEKSRPEICWTNMWRNNYGSLFQRETESADTAQYRFSPNIVQQPDSLPEGSDEWAFSKGMIRVSPFRAEFPGLKEGGSGFASGGSSLPGSLWL